ncbi:probable Hexose transporter 2 [Hanseniaspora guilliermondii]|uniref:Probable Hexose transporter 2 n=1 Tax=Hanseniaspora guilliermondii TaxID=56406 RepID=A0A1L0B5K3_9ASCO|nr:probable Hexose transporter 2 [Hanseniaspora guilliermondii]
MSDVQNSEIEKRSLNTPSETSYKHDDKPFEELSAKTPSSKGFSEFLGVVLLCLMISFGGFVFGFDTGTIGGFFNMGNFRKRFGSYHKGRKEYYFTNVRTGLLVSIFNIGCAFGGIILGGLSDKFGRKKSLSLVAGIYMVGILIQITSQPHKHVWVQYFIGRAISGLGNGAISVICPTFLAETAPANLRSVCVTFYQLMITLGIFMGYCCNYGTKQYSDKTTAQWRVALGLCFAWALLMISGLTLVPESARYLIQKDRLEDGKKSLAFLNKASEDDPIVQGEFDAILAAVEAEKLAGEASYREIFSTKTKVFQRLVMGCVVQSLQQLTGDNYFFYYGTIVFAAVGLNDSFQTSIVIGVVNFFSTFCALYTVERWGRRQVLLTGAITMVCCYVVFASVGVKKLYIGGYSADAKTSKGAGNCMIVFTCFYIFCFANSWAGLAYVICSESYPLRVKNKCMAIASAFNWLWGFLISFFTPFITSAIHFSYGYVFMGCMIFGFFYVFFFVPETKGLTLEEVNEMWLDGVLPWKSTSWVPSSKRGDDYDNEALKHDDKKGLRKFF